jgi:nitrite reductase/ring-hydroxylating ferredoxin subunit
VTRSGTSLELFNEAACWLMRLQDENVPETAVADWLAWCSADPEHLRVFESLERFYDQLRGLPLDHRCALFDSSTTSICDHIGFDSEAPPPCRPVSPILRVKLADIPESGCKIIPVHDKLRVAIFRVGTRVAAINNRCPHAGGSLGEGVFDGTTVNCPRHGFRVDVWKGIGNARKPVQHFRVSIHGDEAAIDVPDLAPRPDGTSAAVR